MIEDAIIRERYELSLERIREITGEEAAASSFADYFSRTAEFILMVNQVYEEIRSGRELSLQECRERNQRLYGDILPDRYEESYGNPAYAVKMLGEGYGQMLSFLYSEVRGLIPLAFEERLEDMTILQETFIEVYNLFTMAAADGAGLPEEKGEDGAETAYLPLESQVKEVLYWYASDYCDQMTEYRVRECLDPSLIFAKRIIMDSDLTDLRYLYRFGEYISDTELQTAEFLNSLPEETVKLMADTYTEGYRRGFEVMRRNLSKKSTVVIRYELGFERMIRMAVDNFRALGLEPVIYRMAVHSVNKTAGRSAGYHSSSPNRQYDYDHRYDSALYLDKAFKDRRTAVLRAAYSKYKVLAAAYAGPAVVETFGQDGFQPVNKKECLSFTEKQEKLARELAGESAQVSQKYVPGDETSFTIIAFPVPEIGDQYGEIFREIIRINTLDYEAYKRMQQALIDVLDQAESVEVTGGPGNDTRLRIALHPLADRERQTNFENCVADVNIPVGEVFTSPVLKGTSGLLHVGNVYIGEFQFRDLKIRFEDGYVKEYSCANFEDPEEGRRLVKQVILKNHDSLPMGEFAIGTNTTAYHAAEKYGITEKLPILIAEKMGPHFAVGDTCYSWAEDSPVYNPDGKEIIARDNETSLLRKEDLSKAYFNCHTDITIPYKELGDIAAVLPDGTRRYVIRNGRFAVAGAEALNEPLEADR